MRDIGELKIMEQRQQSVSNQSQSKSVNQSWIMINQNISTPRKIYQGIQNSSMKLQTSVQKEVEKEKVEQKVEGCFDFSNVRACIQNTVYWMIPMIFSSILFITSFLILIKPSLILESNEGAFEVLDFAFDNLNQSPLIEIKNKKSVQQKCDWDQNLGNFEGIQSGCICQDQQLNIYVSKFFVKSESVCENSGKSGSKCFWVQEVEKQSLNKFLGNSFCYTKSSFFQYNQGGFQQQQPKIQQKNAQFLQKVLNENAYFNQQLLENNSTKQSCAQDLDGLGREQCGLNYLKKVFQDEIEQKNNNSYDNYYDPNEKFSVFQTDSNSIFQGYFNKDGKNVLRPVLNLRFSTSKEICLNQQFAPQTSSKKSYPLLQQKLVGCDKYGSLSDKYIQVLGQGNYLEFLKENSVNLTNLPFINEYQSRSDIVYLLAIKKLELSQSKNSNICFQVDQNFVAIKKSQQNYFFVKNSFNYYLWGISIASVALISLGIYFIMAFFENQNQEIVKIQRAKYYTRSTFIISVLITILGTIYYFQIKRKINSSAEFINSLLQARCFDVPGIQLALDDVYKNLVLINNLTSTEISIQFFSSISYILTWITIYLFTKYILK